MQLLKFLNRKKNSIILLLSALFKHSIAELDLNFKQFYQKQKAFLSVQFKMT